MHNREFCLGKATVFQDDNGSSFMKRLFPENDPSIAYDLDLLYVECGLCGNPVLWDKGKTSHLLRASGIDVSLLDAECLLLSEGCPRCRPATVTFHLQVVRVAALNHPDILLLTGHQGKA